MTSLFHKYTRDPKFTAVVSPAWTDDRCIAHIPYYIIPVPPAGDGWESRGINPSGAVRVGPPAAKAKQTDISTYSRSKSPVPPVGDGWESRGISPSGAVRVGPLSAQDRPPRRRIKRKFSASAGITLYGFYFITVYGKSTAFLSSVSIFLPVL